MSGAIEIEGAEPPKRVRLGLLGCGNVGAALVGLIERDHDEIAARTGISLEVTRVAVRSMSKERGLSLPDGVLTTDGASVASDPDVDVVVEVLGGIEPAREYITAALHAAKPVVTANKELLANVGGELAEVADGAGVEAAGTDPSYPYEGGVIDKWGFGVRDFGLRHPQLNADYMSYCGQVWCSDWQWNATYQRILTLSKWPKSGAGRPADDGAKGPGVLIGAVDPDGKQMWWTGPGGLSPSRQPSATHASSCATAAAWSSPPGICGAWNLPRSWRRCCRPSPAASPPTGSRRCT